MKKRPVLHQLASLCIAASVFFSAAAIAEANTFTPPQELTYPGLTFSTPLTFTTHPLSETTSLISFAAHHKLVINKNIKQKPLEAIVVSPTLPAVQTTITSTPQTTPTIDVQATATELAAEPTATPTPEPSTAVTASPTNYTPAPQSNPGGLNAEDLFGMVNSYRASQGLPAFQEDAKTCSLAQQRAPMVAGEIAAGDMHAGLKAMNLPYWNTENIISMNSDQAAFNWWLNDPIHHDAIVSHNVYSCVACSGNSCAEEFTSYQQK